MAADVLASRCAIGVARSFPASQLPGLLQAFGDGSPKHRVQGERLIEGLEAVVEKLESTELPLEDAIESYQQGVQLAQEGHRRLQDAERRIEALTRDGTVEAIAEAEVLDPNAEA